MPNFDWREHREMLPLARRYPDWVMGHDLLRDFPNLLRNFAHPDLGFDEVLRRIARERHRAGTRTRRMHVGLDRPCVFISHRKDDVDQAERIAWLTCQAGFDYWLDIYDPGLAGYPGLATATEAEARAVALTIEIALLNCTQVIAVMTPNTPGSAWVPYEYGRVKDPVPDSPQAACWLAPGVKLFPEYLYLGARLRTEGDISQWLADERTRMGFLSKPTCAWPHSTPVPL
ncbi:MAG TPA: toll/interleukin-1 receptor domain-containing protein [Steroidobacteraceae bacterium]|nr:toll/interleukin-1 receptor domain-containing protein [Steroidobacteraceae bacterium]